MTRTNKFWVAALVFLVFTCGGLATLACLGVAWADPDIGGACVRDSLSRTPGAACMTLAASLLNWHDPGAVARWFWVDCAFVVVYLSMFVLFALASTRTLFADTGHPARTAIATTLIAIALAGGFADWVENSRALTALQDPSINGIAGSEIDSIAKATTLKWRFLALASLSTLVMSLLAAYRIAARMYRSRISKGLSP